MKGDITLADGTKLPMPEKANVYDVTRVGALLFSYRQPGRVFADDILILAPGVWSRVDFAE